MHSQWDHRVQTHTHLHALAATPLEGWAWPAPGPVQAMAVRARPAAQGRAVRAALQRSGVADPPGWQQRGCPC